MTTDDKKDKVPNNAFYEAAGMITQLVGWFSRRLEGWRLGNAVKAVAPLSDESIDSLCAVFQGLMSRKEFEDELKQRGEVRTKELQQALDLIDELEVESDAKTKGWKWMMLQAGLTEEKVDSMLQELESKLAVRRSDLLRDLRAYKKDKVGLANFQTLDGGEPDSVVLQSMQKEASAEEAAVAS